MECFLLVTVLWVFSVCLHEFGHALVAYYGGDHTVVDKGYLTLNPIHYTHPVLSILMPVLFMVLGGIGLPGGAVYIERNLLRSRGWETGVSLAGPTMNLILVGLISICFKAGWLSNDPQHIASASFAFLMYLQVWAILLNLLPVPPLDGFQAIAPWLPTDLSERLRATSTQGLFIVFAALWMIRPLGEALTSLIYHIVYALGVDPEVVYAGQVAFRFWDR